MNKNRAFASAAAPRNNRRNFDANDLLRLTFIRHARQLGFEVAAIFQRIGSLTALKAELELMIEGCRHGHIGDCRVIEMLADHGQCAHAHH